jgi:methionine-rich copper-binding protein CopC
MKPKGMKSSRAFFVFRKAVGWRTAALSLAGAVLLAGGAPEGAVAYGNGAERVAVTRAQPNDRLPGFEAGASLRPAPKTERPLLLAHAIVVRRSPPEGGTAAKDIGKVDVWYDAGIRDSLAALAVVSEGGERVDKRDAAIDSGDAAHVSVSVNPLTPGKYTVRYRALSADGHLVSGAWDFEVAP